MLKNSLIPEILEYQLIIKKNKKESV